MCMYTLGPAVWSLFQNSTNKAQESAFPRYLQHSLVVLETPVPMVKQLPKCQVRFIFSFLVKSPSTTMKKILAPPLSVYKIEPSFLLLLFYFKMGGGTLREKTRQCDLEHF